MPDIPLVADFNSRMAWETERRSLDFERVKAGVASLLQDPGKGTYFLAEAKRNGTCMVAGQLLITYEWSDWRNGNFWWIQSVYVAGEFRGQGIFRALYEHIHKKAKARRDVCGLRLYMDANNNGARQVYERLGLKRTPYEVLEVDFVMGA
jgi:GNAT superfamily N-acetyltransferase